MREIKFRAWDNSFEQMVPWGELKFDKDSGDDDVCFYEQEDGCDSVHVGGADYELMQYTGLKDKNGREIYEGDILKRTVHLYLLGVGKLEDVDEYMAVEYRNEYAGYFISERPLYHFVGATVDISTCCGCTDVEVVGNIYENPELLEVTE